MLRRRLRRTMMVFSLMGLMLGGGCSGSSPATCPNDYPSTCPDGAATFAAEVAPLIQSHCASCHASSQRRPALQNYQEIRAAAPGVIMQLMSCSMPPLPAPALTSDQRRVLLSWLACGANDN